MPSLAVKDIALSPASLAWSSSDGFVSIVSSFMLIPVSYEFTGRSPPR